MRSAGGGGGGGLFGGGSGRSSNDGLNNPPGAGGGGSSKVPAGGSRALAAAATTPASVQITFTPPAAAAPPPATGGGLTPPDKTKPKLSKLSMSPTSFTAANFGSALIAKVGTKVSYRLTEAATTTFTVQRAVKGRKKGKKCKAGRKRGKRCTIYKKVKGSFKHADVAGKNSFRFQGRIGGKALKKGSYRLVAVSKDRAGNKASKPVYRSFRIK